MFERLRLLLRLRLRMFIRKHIELPQDSEAALKLLYKKSNYYSFHIKLILILAYFATPLILGILDVLPSDSLWPVFTCGIFFVSNLFRLFYIIFIYRNYDDTMVLVITKNSCSSTVGYLADDSHGYQYRLRAHAAKNKVKNARRGLGRIPSLEEAKKYSRTAYFSDVSFGVAKCFIFTTSSIEFCLIKNKTSSTLFYIYLLTIGIFLMLYFIGVFRWADYFITQTPTDKEIQGEIDRMKEVENS